MDTNSRKRGRALGGMGKGARADVLSGGASEDDDHDEFHAMTRTSDRRRPKVDLSKLDVPTLRKYKRVYGLGDMFNSTKEEIVPVVARHFASQVVDEDDILLNFAFSLKKQFLARSDWQEVPMKKKARASRT